METMCTFNWNPSRKEDYTTPTLSIHSVAAEAGFALTGNHSDSEWEDWW